MSEKLSWRRDRHEHRAMNLRVQANVADAERNNFLVQSQAYAGQELDHVVAERRFRLERSQRAARRNRWLLANAWWLIAAAVAGAVFLVAGR